MKLKNKILIGIFSFLVFIGLSYACFIIYVADKMSNSIKNNINLKNEIIKDKNIFDSVENVMINFLDTVKIDSIKQSNN